MEKFAKVTHDVRIRSHNARDPSHVQLLRLARGDHNEIGVGDPHGNLGKLPLDLAEDHAKIFRIELVQLNPLRKDTVRLEDLHSPVVELRGEKAGYAGNPWV